MTTRSWLVFALVAGIAGAFIGRASPRAPPSVQAVPSASPPSSTAASPRRGCKEERTVLASTRAQLELCMALRSRVPEAEPSGAAKPSEPDPLESQPFDQRMSKVEEIRRNRRLLDGYSEAVIVQHYDGRTGVYKPDEWLDHGDGYIVARKLPSGRIGYYAGPDAGPRSDPAAFRPTKSTIVLAPDFVREADGAIRVRRGASTWIKRRLGERVDEPASP
ncbi:hypothetical protein [Sorangium atrum]|uniref:Secreted protein n=1 Tax=Sorangium atrum TaxID=2995308 RepID=A0ABT5C7D4_9BACT|nr:hypothetical protein [Sorangium aterium]MDC0681745.1 hypothetical protein [Sorangium aterium]